MVDVRFKRGRRGLCRYEYTKRFFSSDYNFNMAPGYMISYTAKAYCIPTNKIHGSTIESAYVSKSAKLQLNYVPSL